MSEIEPNSEVSVLWEPNSGGRFPVKSNRLNGKRLDKIVLIDSEYDGRIPLVDTKWRCRVVRTVNKKAQNRGAILVEPIRQEINREFPDVWMPDDVRIQMPIILETPGKNLFLQGDHGCGKTIMAGAISLGFDWEFCKVSGGAIKKYVYLLTRVMAGERNGRLTFRSIDSDLAMFLREAIANRNKRYLIMFDELTRMEVNSRDILLDVIEGLVRFLPLPTGERLEVPENVRFMAAGNMVRGFTVQKQDSAFSSRWVILKVDYMPAEPEFNLLIDRYPQCPEKLLRKAIEIANITRDARFGSGAQRLSKGVSTRETDTAAMLLQRGVPIQPALQTAYVNQYEGDIRDTKSEAYKVFDVIKKAA